MFECDVGLLIENNITVEQYFVMYHLYNNDYSFLIKYVKGCGKIPTTLFKSLILKGYLEEVEDNDFNQETLKLTDKFELTFIKVVGKMDFETCFKQFWDSYPNRVKSGLKERFLRADKEVCKNLYKKIIIDKGKIDLAKHSLILQCINYEVNKNTKSGDMIYMRNSSTWLRNKSWESYQDIVEKIIYKGGSVNRRDDGEEEVKNAI